MKIKTPAAQAAALIRKELNAAGINYSKVTSENYSMGCNVNITLVDALPETRKIADKICKKYQEGHFDGMNDIYEYSNSRDDLPQAKYVFVRNEMSDDRKQHVYNWLRANWHGGDQLPLSYSDGCRERLDGEDVSQMVWRCFTGAIEGYWKQVA